MMTKRIFFSIITAALFSPCFVRSQSIEKIIFDAKDSVNGYYLAIRPQSKNIKGVLVLLTSFIPPENLLPETKLHNVSYVNDILTVVASTKQKLYADSVTVGRINFLLEDMVKRFSLKRDQFVLAGFDEAGCIALRYTELAYEFPDRHALKPKAVFGIDSPVDLFGLWHWSENQVKKNYWPGSVGNAKFYLDAMTKENGTIYDNPERYKRLSPFDKASETTGNERYLQKIPVRLYYDTDIEWQLKNRRNSFYDTKMPDGSEFIKRLLLLGDEQAELVVAAQPGMKNDGTRHPNSMSIVNEAACIQWIKKSLGIFDPNTWVPPYNLSVPEGWSKEIFSLPPDFAPQINCKGVEDVRFSPGWGDINSNQHWTYGFLWWMEDAAPPDANTLQADLTAYYDGLVARNIISRNIPANKTVPTIANIKKIKTASCDTATFSGTVNLLDYHTAQPMVLTCLIHIKGVKGNHTTVFFEVSPKPLEDPVWQPLHAMALILK